MSKRTPSKPYRSPVPLIKKIGRLLRVERFFLIGTLTLILILFCSIAIYYFENNKEGASIHSLWDGFWWAIVTICTVGYGDKLPTTDAGRIVGLVLMILGVCLLSLITATIASVFVEQKIREGKGLDTLTCTEHTVICGWNRYTEEVIAWINTHGKSSNPVIILINELPIDDIDALKLKYEHFNLRFIRGNYVHEDVLLRANIEKAAFVILMADNSGAYDKERADERTILATLTVRSVAPKAKIVAEVINAENRTHLKRASVDEIIVRGEHLGSLIASAISHPGLPKVFSNILSLEGSNKIKRIIIPNQFVGKTFGDFERFIKERKEGILIGLMTEKESMKLEDMLSDDTSIIEKFIKEKIQESKKDYFYEKENIKVSLNPDENTIIGRNVYGIVLAKEMNV